MYQRLDPWLDTAIINPKLKLESRDNNIQKSQKTGYKRLLLELEKEMHGIQMPISH